MCSQATHTLFHPTHASIPINSAPHTLPITIPAISPPLRPALASHSAVVHAGEGTSMKASRPPLPLQCRGSLHPDVGLKAAPFSTACVCGMCEYIYVYVCMHTYVHTCIPCGQPNCSIYINVHMHICACIRARKSMTQVLLEVLILSPKKPIYPTILTWIIMGNFNSNGIISFRPAYSAWTDSEPQGGVSDSRRGVQ
jgi:hypothetical protein